MNRSRALRTLAELSKKEPFTMRQFMEASEYVWDSADRLLTELEQDGLVEVTTRQEGSVAKKEIRLTTIGREMAPHLRAIEALHKRAREQKK